MLDNVPTFHLLSNVDRSTASAHWHWFFLPLGNGIPERLIGDDPEFFLRSVMAALLRGPERDLDALAEYIRYFPTPPRSPPHARTTGPPPPLTSSTMRQPRRPARSWTARP